MKKCKQGYYYCYTDEVCKPIPKGLRVTARFSGGGKEPEETGIDTPTNGNGNGGNGNGNGGNGNGNGGGNGGGMSESKSGDSSLRDWFGKSRSSDGKPGWVQLGGKYAGKPCAKQPGQTTKPKCGSSKMAANLDDKEEKKAFNRKQRQDPNPDRKGKAINVKTEETVIEKAGEKDACYKKVKSRYSVWPSAYASGALVKCRKVGAANWGNSTKKESYELSNWRDDFQATEYEFVDIIKAEPIKGGQEQIEEGQKCWKGYEKKGTKKMFGKTYNNCVKKEGYDVGDVDQKVGAVTPIPKSEQDAARARLLAKAKAKREKMKEEKEESRVGGGNLKKLTAKAVRRIDADVDGDIDSVDMKSPETGVFVPSPDGKKKLKPKVRFEQSDWKNELEEKAKDCWDTHKKVGMKMKGGKLVNDCRPKNEETEVSEGAAWTKKSGKSKSGGLNEKGRKSYERENPGSDLKAPSKKVGNPRRKSFCARMKGMRKRQKPSNNTGDDRLSKSLRAWNC